MNRNLSHRNLLILALVFAGCALAGHSLLKPEPIKWLLNSEQRRTTKIISLDEITNYKDLHHLIVTVKSVKKAHALPEHSFILDVFCTTSDTLLKQQHFSTYPLHASGKFIVQLPEKFEECFNEDATAQIKVNLSLNTQNSNTYFVRRGELYIE